MGMVALLVGQYMRAIFTQRIELGCIAEVDVELSGLRGLDSHSLLLKWPEAGRVSADVVVARRQVG